MELKEVMPVSVDQTANVILATVDSKSQLNASTPRKSYIFMVWSVIKLVIITESRLLQIYEMVCWICLMVCVVSKKTSLCNCSV